jgi:hypothetical protein
MLIRIRILRRPITRLLIHYNMKQLILTAEEWGHVEYLIELTVTFNAVTHIVGQSNTAALHTVFEAYNHLFNHIDKNLQRLAKKKAPWKTAIRDSLTKAKDKLTKYYSHTDGIHGDMYAFAALLHPTFRHTALSGSDWRGKPTSNNDPPIQASTWHGYYTIKLRRYWEKHYRPALVQQAPKADKTKTSMELMRRRNAYSSAPSSGLQDELDRFLCTCEFRICDSSCDSR